MKLKQTMTEKSYRDELLSSQKFLTLDKKGLKITNIIKARYPEISSAYILKHIPDQEADFYEIIIDGKHLFSIEINRLNTDVEPIVTKLNFHSYHSKLSQTNKIKFMVAVDLSKQHKGTTRCV
jgi:hypothetical protein